MAATIRIQVRRQRTSRPAEEADLRTPSGKVLPY
jgi:hypothetical protein